MQDGLLRDVSECFSETYFEAREKFLNVATSSISCESPARTPAAEKLFADGRMVW